MLDHSSHYCLGEAESIRHHASFREQSAERLDLQSVATCGKMTQWPEYGKRLELWEAVYKQDLSKVQRLLATPLGIRQVNVPHGMWMQTSVHLAVRKGSSKLLRTMLVAHADVNTRMVNGTTPLHLAVEMKRKDLVQDLLLIGADPMLRNFTNKNAIEMAQDLQLRDIASLLIKAANSLPAQRELKKQQDQAEQLAR